LWEVISKILNGPYLKKVNKVNKAFKLSKIAQGIKYLMCHGFNGPEIALRHPTKYNLYKGTNGGGIFIKYRLTEVSLKMHMGKF